MSMIRGKIYPRQCPGLDYQSHSGSDSPYYFRDGKLVRKDTGEEVKTMKLSELIKKLETTRSAV